jgi:hypothetical protein
MYLRVYKKCMKINKKELEKWVKDCGVSGCRHKEPANEIFDNTVCEHCKRVTTTHCGHVNGTKYACLYCGQKWECSK